MLEGEVQQEASSLSNCSAQDKGDHARVDQKCKGCRERRRTPLNVNERPQEVERLQGIIQHLKREAITSRNRIDHETRRQDAELEALRRMCQQQREKMDRQKNEIHTLELTLRDYRVTDNDQQRTLNKFNASAETQLHRLRLQMASMQQAHEQAQEKMQQQFSVMRKERAAMCMGFAAVAQQSIGGPDANAEDLAADVDAALAERHEPIPRNPLAWSQLKFHLDDMGNLASFSHGPSSHLRPFDRDGARAVAALSAQVARLFSQRGMLRTRLRNALQDSKQHFLDSGECMVLRELVANLQRDVEQLSQLCSQDAAFLQCPSVSTPSNAQQALQKEEADAGSLHTPASAKPDSSQAESAAAGGHYGEAVHASAATTAGGSQNDPAAPGPRSLANKEAESQGDLDQEAARAESNQVDQAANSPEGMRPAELEQARNLSVIKRAVWRIASTLADARQELHALRQGSRLPPSKRNTPMATRGRLAAKHLQTKPKSGVNAYKAAADSCAAALAREMAARTAKAPPSPPRTAPAEAPSYLVPVKLATKPGTASLEPATVAAAAAGKRGGPFGQQQIRPVPAVPLYDHNGRRLPPPPGAKKSPPPPPSSSSSSSEYSHDGSSLEACDDEFEVVEGED